RINNIEDIPKTNLLSTQESQCEETFQREYRRTDEGRFEVSLPFRADPNTLRESKAIAFKRLCSMERKFRKDPELQARYIEFMNEYVRLGHMSILPNDEEKGINYLPQHAVIKEASISTKLRVVFDASSPTTSGKSLNDCLLVGPTIQPKLFELLIRFRQHPYVLTGDIVKMYRQVMVKPEHRLHQCILWRDNPNKPVKTFTLNMVTYGVASAPYLRNKSGKVYLCLIVCMATKAIHLELVSDLSTEGFLNALKRFISRRGKCDSILSDNGRNFVGASQFLSQSDHQATIINYASNLGILWKFIPPHSPHMGGLWKANVKSVKTHLKAVINDTLLSFEEFYTVLTQIEAILNSRPLCPLSNSPDELEVLIPGHFLIGTSLMALPEKSVLDIPQNRINRYQLLTHLQQSFWKCWSKEYVAQLQQHTKWKTVVRNNELQIGKLVIIRDETSPPLKWRIGRICELHAGTDSPTRVVSLKITTGIIQRPLAKICVLPID
ncbi:hypothetical protein ALC62_08632, partial [Cyphomyrmex costatus]